MTTFKGPNGQNYTHGTANAYVNGLCRCDLCRTNQTARARKRERAKVYGRWQSPFVDAQPVRDHVNALRAQGWGVKQIARLAGVPATPVSVLIYGRTPGQQTESKYTKPAQLTKMSRTNAEKLLALQFDPLISTDGTVIDARGAHRRIQALMRLGYSVSYQAQLIGWSSPNLHSLMDRTHCDAGTLKLICEMYERLHLTKPRATNRHEQASITRTVKTAIRHAHPAPADWDDIDNDEAPTMLDDTQEIIDHVKIEQVRDGKNHKLTRAEVALATELWLQEGLTASTIDTLLGYKVGSTATRLRRHAQAA